MEKCQDSLKSTFKNVKGQIQKGANPEKAARSGYENACDYFEVLNKRIPHKYHLDSTLVKPTQERWFNLQDLILPLKLKHVLTARCLMSLIGLLQVTYLPQLRRWSRGTPSHEVWQNPANVMKGTDLHPKDHSIQIFTDASNEG